MFSTDIAFGNKASVRSRKQGLPGDPSLRKGRRLSQVISIGVRKHNLPVEIVVSARNDFVKHCVKLRTSPKYRQECGRALLTGWIPVGELLTHCTTLITLQDGRQPEGVQASKNVRVSSMVMSKICGVETIPTEQAVAAEVQLPVPADFLTANLKRLLVLDGLQDPGNVGTLLRTAQALGWQGAFLLPAGCCDPFNDKALRAGRGVPFRFPLAMGDWRELQAILDHHSLVCLAAQPPAEGGNVKLPPSGVLPAAGGAALVLGAEGSGLSIETQRHATSISIAMPGKADSLNVSQAGAILMFMLSEGWPVLAQQLHGMQARSN